MEEQQRRTHRSILNGIARLSDPRHHEERHKLIINGLNRDGHLMRPMDHRSLEHLVTFLDNGDDSREAIVTELELFLSNTNLPRPSDGGCLNVLCGFFSRSDTTLTRVALHDCFYGEVHGITRLLASFQTNTTVTVLSIRSIYNLRSAALGSCLSGLLQSMAQLQRLECHNCHLLVEGVRAIQPGLRNNHTLKELNLPACSIGDEGIRLVADALVGNTTMDVLNISQNDITSNGLDDITRLLESTRLKSITLWGNQRVFDDEASTQRFAHVLSRHGFLKELRLFHCQLGDDGIRLIVDGLVGNTIMEALDISWNGITSVGLAGITRLLQSTQLKTITLWGNREIFSDEDAIQHFVSTLQHKSSSVQELPSIVPYDFSKGTSRAETYIQEPQLIRPQDFPFYASIKNSLKRNQQLNRVNLLLAPPRPQQQQQQERNTSTMLLKTWHKAIVKFAMVPHNAGASAIFKLFTARPQLLEKRLKRPATASAAVSQEQKRRRL